MSYFNRGYKLKKTEKRSVAFKFGRKEAKKMK